MTGADEGWTIGMLARKAGVGVETIRFYHRKGLLPAPDKPYGGIRRYGEAHLKRLLFIKAAQGLGFRLSEVADLLRLDDGMHCAEAREVAERKLMEIRKKLEQLQRIEQLLAEQVARCTTENAPASCPLIAELYALLADENHRAQ